jgi:hypothetical protein
MPFTLAALRFFKDMKRQKNKPLYDNLGTYDAIAD